MGLVGADILSVGQSPSFEPSGGIADTGEGANPRNPVERDPLVVTIDGQIVRWLGADISIVHRVNDFPQATLGVAIARGFGVDNGADGHPAIAPLHEIINDGQVIEIGTGRDDLALDVNLFRGHVARRSHRNDGPDSASITLEHIGTDLHYLPRFTVVGQVRPNGDGYNAVISDPAAPIPLMVAKTLPAIFNLNNRPNCWSHQVDYPDVELGPGGVTGTMPVRAFFDGQRAPDGEAVYWSWARVFAYLFYVARRNGAGAGQEGFPGHWGDSERFFDWNLLDIIKDRELLQIEPESVGNPASLQDPWTRVLLERPVNHVIDGLSWWDALKATCLRAGINFAWEPRQDSANGYWHWGLRFFLADADPVARDGNRRVQIRFPSDALNTQQPLANIRRFADASSLQIAADYSKVRNSGQVVGGPNHYEVTVELVPGWPANGDWDVDPGSQSAVDAAIANIGSAGWSNKYDGSQPGNVGADRLVGRYWVLNTQGQFSAAQYGRLFGPFTAARYGLFDLADVGAGEGQGRRGKGFPRPRPFGPQVTTLQGTKRNEPEVEVSFNGGSSWVRANLSITVLRVDAAIAIREAKLGDFVDPSGNTSETFATAYIRGLLRVRITATLQGDVAIGVDRFVSTAGSLSQRARHRLYLKRDAVVLRREDRDGFGGGNSKYQGSGFPSAERDDFTQVDHFMVSEINGNDRVPHVGSIELPEIVFYEDRNGNPDFATGYRPGDLVDAIVAEPTATGGEWVLPLDTRPGERGAVIAALEWRYSEGTPERGGMAYNTRIQLEAQSSLAQFRQGLTFQGGSR